MKTTERKLPSDNNMCLRFLLGKKDRTLESYCAACSEFEGRIEESLKNTLGRLNITATVKADRFSLPYNNEVVITLQGESYMNAPFEIHRVARKVAQALLAKSVFNLRFYVFVEIVDGAMGFGRVNYHFRYHLRNDSKE